MVNAASVRRVVGGAAAIADRLFGNATARAARAGPALFPFTWYDYYDTQSDPVHLSEADVATSLRIPAEYG